MKLILNILKDLFKKIWLENTCNYIFDINQWNNVKDNLKKNFEIKEKIKNEEITYYNNLLEVIDSLKRDFWKIYVQELLFLKKNYYLIEDFEKINIEDLELWRKIKYFLENFKNLLNFLLSNISIIDDNTYFYNIPDSKYNYFMDNIDNFYNKFEESYNDLFL